MNPWGQLTAFCQYQAMLLWKKIPHRKRFQKGPIIWLLRGEVGMDDFRKKIGSSLVFI